MEPNQVEAFLEPLMVELKGMRKQSKRTNKLLKKIAKINKEMSKDTHISMHLLEQIGNNNHDFYTAMAKWADEFTDWTRANAENSDDDRIESLEKEVEYLIDRMTKLGENHLGVLKNFVSLADYVGEATNQKGRPAVEVIDLTKSIMEALGRRDKDPNFMLITAKNKNIGALISELLKKVEDEELNLSQPIMFNIVPNKKEEGFTGRLTFTKATKEDKKEAPKGEQEKGGNGHGKVETTMSHEEGHKEHEVVSQVQ